MARHIVRSGEVTAVATPTNLVEGEGSTTVEETIQNDKIIRSISGTAPTDAAANGANAAIVKFSGTAVLNGTHSVCIGGNLVDGTAAAAAFVAAVPQRVDINLKSGQLKIQGILEGDDTGDARFGVSCMLE